MDFKLFICNNLRQILVSESSNTAYIADYTISLSSKGKRTMSTNERGRLTIKRVRSGCAPQPRALQQKSAIISHQYFSGNKYSQYPTKTFGFSVAGKWPTPFIAWCLPPVIFSQVAWPISGVLLQSYSPVSMYTGHFLVSMLDMRLRPSHPPAKMSAWVLLDLSRSS